MSNTQNGRTDAIYQGTVQLNVVPDYFGMANRKYLANNPGTPLFSLYKIGDKDVFHIRRGEFMFRCTKANGGSLSVHQYGRVTTSFNWYPLHIGQVAADRENALAILARDAKDSAKISKLNKLIYKKLRSEVEFLGIARINTDHVDGAPDSDMAMLNEAIMAGIVSTFNSGSYDIEAGMLVRVRPPGMFFGERSAIRSIDGLSAESDMTPFEHGGIPEEKVTGILEPYTHKTFFEEDHTREFLSTMMALAFYCGAAGVTMKDAIRMVRSIKSKEISERPLDDEERAFVRSGETFYDEMLVLCKDELADFMGGHIQSLSEVVGVATTSAKPGDSIDIHMRHF